MSTFRKGIVTPPTPATPKMPDGNSPGIPTFDSSNKRIGKAVNRAAPPTPTPMPRVQDRITRRAELPPAAPPRAPSMLVDGTGRPIDPAAQAPRVGILTANGVPVRGLQQETIKGMAERSEAANTWCTGCEQWFPYAQTKTVIPNAENSSNPVVLCAACQRRCYKDPHDPNQQWKPSVPSVRFDYRDKGKPYDAKRAGLTVKDVINRDAYLNEAEAEIVDERVVTDGWSGGGRIGRVGRTRR